MKLKSPRPNRSTDDNLVAASPMAGNRFGFLAAAWPALLSALFLHLAFTVDPVTGPQTLFAVAMGLSAATMLATETLRDRRWNRGRCFAIYVSFLAFWLLQLQGLRHAHPAMFLAWLAMSAYLAIYPVAFVWMSRRLCRRFHPLLSLPLAWMTTELIRNYFATGISIAMLGHTAAGWPRLNWLATLGGTLAVSTVMMAAGVSLAMMTDRDRGGPRRRRWADSLGLVPMLIAATIGPPATEQSAVQPTVALVQRDETVDYGHSLGREMAIFDAYVRQTLDSLSKESSGIDAIVWPESMLTGGVPWMIAEENFVVPPDAGVSREEFLTAVEQQREYFVDRMDELQRRVAEVNGGRRVDIVGGCGVVRYGDVPRTYSGMVAIGPEGRVEQWYGKRHLVMFGEYIPWIGSIPGLRNLIPPGLGVTAGKSTQPMRVGRGFWLPNICIETAVERVASAAVRAADDAGQRVDAIVTVTNDGWFDHSAVVRHHRLAARMVAVTTGRPILSCANGGPTAIIDCDGRVVSDLAGDQNATLIGRVPAEIRETWQTRWLDWPWWFLAAVTIVGCVICRAAAVTSPSDDDGEIT